MGRDESTEDFSDHSEHRHVDDSLDVLLEHAAHHVGVLHKVHLVLRLDLLVEVALLLVAVESLSQSDGVLWEPRCMTSDFLRSLQRLPLSGANIGRLQAFEDVNLAFWELS